MNERIQFGADGLVPVVVQDAVTGDVLMLAFMNALALRRTRETGRAHYWSRGRQALWRKGETSGNEQIVEEIRVNCEENSLLLVVRQTGTVCHTGYPTCFYRRLEPDGSLTTVRERAFDPADVYGGHEGSDARQAQTDLVDPLAEATRRQFAAYAWLRDHDLAAVSDTSARLRAAHASIAPRLADELRELAGVLDGTHRHADRPTDLRLEASQVIYWVLLAALRHGVTWARLRPDVALATFDDIIAPPTIARLLRAEADRWETEPDDPTHLAARGHATLALVGQACRSGDVDPLTAIEMDLADLRTRSYLKASFAAAPDRGA
jgi:phosphoribosyl-AMP cyclohydrolase